MITQVLDPKTYVLDTRRLEKIQSRIKDEGVQPGPDTCLVGCVIDIRQSSNDLTTIS